ncbi:hypothetical protein K501DRAFT_176397 [Backusella circina FSU 941]|nr:hypothetical protein K501DRAFT_176397 [Backusella circina FSU 941]
MSQLQLLITNVDYKRKDPVFWIDVKTDLTKYKQKQKRLPRYYSELVKLHNHLDSTLDDVLIPALPTCPLPHFDKDGEQVGRRWWFTIRLSGESPSPVETGAIENKIQRWLNRVAEHKRAQLSEGLREFVESEVGFRPKSKFHKSKSKQTIASITEEYTEPEFIHRSQELESFSHHLFALEQKLDKMVTEQKEMSQRLMDLGSAWVNYGGMERNPGLFITYKGLAKGYHQLSDMERSQAQAVCETLHDEVHYQIRNTDSAQDAMQRRQSTLSTYLTSRRYTESSLRAVERLKSSVNINREQASNAIAVLENARINERDSLQRYQRIDSHLREDIEERYKPAVSMDIMDALKEYARSQLYLEKKKLSLWQGVIMGSE